MHPTMTAGPHVGTHLGHSPNERTGRTRRSVLIITAQPLLGHALSSCFTAGSLTTGAPGAGDTERIELVLAGTARTVEDAVAAMRCRNTAVDVVVLDLDLIVGGVCEAVSTLLSQVPSLRILTLSSSPDVDRTVTALRAGACGHLSKEAECADFMAAVRRCVDQDLVVDEPTLRTIAALAIGRCEPTRGPGTASEYGLDHQEVAVIDHLARGRSNQEIAAALFVSVGSVKAYLTGASKKLGVRDRVQLLVRAYELGLVSPHLA